MGTDRLRVLKGLQSEALNAIRPSEMPSKERLRKAVSDLMQETYKAADFL